MKKDEDIEDQDESIFAYVIDYCIGCRSEEILDICILSKDTLCKDCLKQIKQLRKTKWQSLKKI